MFRLALIIWAMAATVLAGVFVLTVLVVPSLAAQDAQLILPAALSGAALAVPFSYLIAKRLLNLTK
ncbi:MAG: hypothetical protein H6860_00145 [Rhodospirillales bacterium]|nr:hypothetical protein [Alphaproteobacteria bacterium]MCB9980805.1 hypothetical protein [Rhodospirillales bacterium]